MDTATINELLRRAAIECDKADRAADAAGSATTDGQLADQNYWHWEQTVEWLRQQL